MKVSERSWHLRLARVVRGRDYKPRDLCSYFWGGLVFSALVVLALIAALLFVAWQLVLAVVRHPWEALGGATVALVLGGLLVTMTWWFGRPPKNRPPSPPRPPNPVVEYLRAKKRRVCPLIELEP